MSDLTHRKKSLPVVAALNGSNSSARQLAALYSRSEPLTDDEVVLAATLIEQAGGRAWTKAEIRHQIDAASRCLDVLGPASPERAKLLSIADFIDTRDH